MSTQKPRPELVAVAYALDSAVSKYRSAQWPPDVKAMSPVEGLVMSWNVARNVQAVTLLARADELLLPAAWANTRTAFEVGVRIIWVLFPGDPKQSELRLLPMLDEYARYHENMDAENATFSIRGSHKKSATELRTYLTLARAKIPDGYQEPPGIPKMQLMLTETENANLYAAYIEASQYQHGSMAASAAYRRASGAFAEVVNLREWLLPVRLSWITLREVANFVSLRMTGRVFDWGALPGEIDSLIKALEAADPSPRQ
jgi:hypothetical protein